MTRFAVFFMIFTAGFSALPARAEGPVLVELFASKNCRASPAAHRAMQTLDETRPDILVLTWAVDYWDYLGGKDTMALPESKERQRGYVEHFSLRGPYTPQTVFDGAKQAAGNRKSRVDTALASAASLPRSEVRLIRAGDNVTITGNPGGLVDLWWVSYLTGPANTTDMVNPVTSARQLGPWLGGLADIDLPACSSGCALVVQEAGFGRVLGVLEIG